MDPSAFTEWGYLGAVIFLVVAFGAYLYRRDKEWRDFFTLLNQRNQDDMGKVSTSLDKLIEAVRCVSDGLQEHDRHVDERVKAVQVATRRKVGSD